MGSGKKLITGLVAGAMVGTVAGLLLAPKSGKENRKKVGEKAAKVRADLERAEQVPAVRSDIKKGKALEWLVEHVSIVDDDGDPIDRADLEIPADDADDSSAGVTGAAIEGVGYGGVCRLRPQAEGDPGRRKR